MAEHTQPPLDLISMSDEFIKVANKLMVENHQEMWQVSAAIRFAAARFNAYEASFKSGDLERDKQDALIWFTEEYRKMFSENLDFHIANKQIKD
jgi:Protein of unknown function (DUF3144)